MDQLKEYNIPFVGLKEGRHNFHFVVDNTFFDAFDYEEFNHSKINITLEFEKKSTLLNLKFIAKGSVNIPCDVTDEPFDYPIETTFDWVVKFGDTYDDSNEELLILPHSSYQIDVAQPIYEMVVLSLPAKRIHPGVEDGTLQSDILKKLEELQPKVEQNNNDPRWNKLKDLL